MDQLKGNITAWLGRCQRARGYNSVSKLCRESGVDPTTVLKFLQTTNPAKHIPTTKTLRKISIHTGIPVFIWDLPGPAIALIDMLIDTGNMTIDKASKKDDHDSPVAP